MMILFINPIGSLFGALGNLGVKRTQIDAGLTSVALGNGDPNSALLAASKNAAATGEELTRLPGLVQDQRQNLGLSASTIALAIPAARQIATA